ncbi:Aste57867_21665 [Aphanomyces stellatus]|uniref:Aste57867_21665 protein n=1 Tax=Aphanomyces stellatus TaxID=120398 RepID=A0A485LIS3_9STRA|nr:hypothetical protein As57867_021596 [Aphanomyces stellatus]VFT98334.1 Aste57867_21665 [Aphanomyces stellatus]
MQDTVPAPVLGLTVGYFKHLIALHGGRDRFEGLSTCDVCIQFVLPLTQSTQLSLVDHVHREDPNGDQYVKPATWFVSHAWSYTYLDVVDALSAFFDEQGLECNNVAVWFCMFNNNQHLVTDQIKPFEFWVDSFQTALKAIGNVVMVLSPWNNPTTLTRTWCVFEIYVAIVTKARFEVAMGKAQKQAFLDDIKDDNSFAKMLATIKSESSQTAVASDRDNIESLMRAAKITFADLDRMLLDELNDWVLRTVQRQIDLAVAPTDKAHWLAVLGDIMLDKMELAKAKQYLEQAHQLYRREVDHPGVWKTLAKLGCTASYANEPRAVWEPMFQDAFDHQLDLYGKDHYETLLTMGCFGDAYIQHGSHEIGLALLHESFDRSDRLFGDSKQLTMSLMKQIGWALVDRCQFVDAERWLAGAYRRMCIALGEDHFSTKSAVNSLAIVYVRQGKFALGMEMIHKAHQDTRRSLGPDHEYTYILYLNLGEMHRLVGQYDVAKRIFDECADAATRLKQSAQRQLYCTWAQGRYALCTDAFEAAHDALGKAHNGFKQLFTPTHHDAKKMLYWRCFDMYASHGCKTIPAIDHLLDQLMLAECFHDTWSSFSCHGCFQPIQGTMFACGQCPKYARTFCHACVAVGTPTRFCDHDASSSTKGLLPPARYLQEQRLTILAQDANWTAYDAYFETYNAYCTTYQVPEGERLVEHSPMRARRVR